MRMGLAKSQSMILQLRRENYAIDAYRLGSMASDKRKGKIMLVYCPSSTIRIQKQPYSAAVLLGSCRLVALLVSCQSVLFSQSSSPLVSSIHVFTMPITVGSARIGFGLSRHVGAFIALLADFKRANAFRLNSDRSRPLDLGSKRVTLSSLSDDGKSVWTIKEVPDTEDSDDVMLNQPWRRTVASFLGVTALPSVILAVWSARIQATALLDSVKNSDFSSEKMLVGLFLVMIELLIIGKPPTWTEFIFD
jgi:hypothetical protein